MPVQGGRFITFAEAAGKTRVFKTEDRKELFCLHQPHQSEAYEDLKRRLKNIISEKCRPEKFFRSEDGKRLRGQIADLCIEREVPGILRRWGLQKPSNLEEILKPVIENWIQELQKNNRRCLPQNSTNVAVTMSNADRDNSRPPPAKKAKRNRSHSPASHQSSSSVGTRKYDSFANLEIDDSSTLRAKKQDLDEQFYHVRNIPAGLNFSCQAFSFQDNTPNPRREGLTLNDLSFDQFISKCQTEFGFDPGLHKVFWVQSIKLRSDDNEETIHAFARSAEDESGWFEGIRLQRRSTNPIFMFDLRERVDAEIAWALENDPCFTSMISQQILSRNQHRKPHHTISNTHASLDQGQEFDDENTTSAYSNLQRPNNHVALDESQPCFAAIMHAEGVLDGNLISNSALSRRDTSLSNAGTLKQQTRSLRSQTKSSTLNNTDTERRMDISYSVQKNFLNPEDASEAITPKPKLTAVLPDNMHSPNENAARDSVQPPPISQHNNLNTATRCVYKIIQSRQPRIS